MARRSQQQTTSTEGESECNTRGMPEATKRVRLTSEQKRSDAEGKENVDRSAESIFHVDILTAIRWAQEAWQLVTSSTIENCWRHTGIVDEDFYELVGSMEKVRIGPSLSGSWLCGACKELV